MQTQPLLDCQAIIMNWQSVCIEILGGDFLSNQAILHIHKGPEGAAGRPQVRHQAN